MSTICITFNGSPHTVTEGLTLEALMNSLRPADPAAGAIVASAVNGRHVARRARASVILQDQDAVTTFEPISGG